MALAMTHLLQEGVSLILPALCQSVATLQRVHLADHLLFAHVTRFCRGVSDCRRDVRQRCVGRVVREGDLALGMCGCATEKG